MTNAPTTITIKSHNATQGSVRWIVRVDGRIFATGTDINPERAQRTADFHAGLAAS